MELRRRFRSVARGTRRLYFSRRDAKVGRRWVLNEPAVEELFKARGFEIVNVAAFPLHDMVRLFSEARVVAGINGAGLAHILFSPEGTHVIPLFSDSLIRWHADEEGTRSLWARDRQVAVRRLSALGDSPRVYAHVAAAFEQYCHSFVGSDEMPLDPLAGFLDDVLATVDGVESGGGKDVRMLR
jgi:capsular polysaccharide biosynthesis protein